MKRKRGLGINIHLSNRWLYTFIALGILIAVGVGVWAATYTASGAGHPYTEISTCSNGQTLVTQNGVWACVDAITKDYADLNYKDPPGQWTCTLRAGAGSKTSSTASCVGNEKVINGGCSSTAAISNNYMTGNRPTANGWSCTCYSSGNCGTLTAYAYCCL